MQFSSNMILELKLEIAAPLGAKFSSKRMLPLTCIVSSMRKRGVAWLNENLEF